MNTGGTESNLSSLFNFRYKRLSHLPYGTKACGIGMHAPIVQVIMNHNSKHKSRGCLLPRIRRPLPAPHTGLPRIRMVARVGGAKCPPPARACGWHQRQPAKANSDLTQQSDNTDERGEAARHCCSRFVWFQSIIFSPEAKNSSRPFVCRAESHASPPLRAWRGITCASI